MYGCPQGDWTNWPRHTDKIGDKVQRLGEELLATNVKPLQRGSETATANSILAKVNQIRSLTWTLDAVELAPINQCTAVLSHRSGDDRGRDHR